MDRPLEIPGSPRRSSHVRLTPLPSSLHSCHVTHWEMPQKNSNYGLSFCLSAAVAMYMMLWISRLSIAALWLIALIARLSFCLDRNLNYQTHQGFFIMASDT